MTSGLSASGGERGSRSRPSSLKGRLWLADGSCITLRAEYPSHVWNYDFIEYINYVVRKYWMLKIIDEYISLLSGDVTSNFSKSLKKRYFSLF